MTVTINIDAVVRSVGIKLDKVKLVVVRYRAIMAWYAVLAAFFL